MWAGRDFLRAPLDALKTKGCKTATWGTKRILKIKERARAELRKEHPAEFAMLDGIRSALPRDTIVAAQSMIGHWCRFALDCYEPSSFLFANSYGSMGFAFHAAIGAKIAAPDRPVAAFCGDGGFMMGCGEMATIAQLGLNIPIVIVNNGGFAILRSRQLSNYQRTIGTDLFNPDFPTFAPAFGFEGRRIERLEDLPVQLREAIGSDRSYLIEVPIEFTDYRSGSIQ